MAALGIAVPAGADVVTETEYLPRNFAAVPAKELPPPDVTPVAAKELPPPNVTPVAAREVLYADAGAQANFELPRAVPAPLLTPGWTEAQPVVHIIPPHVDKPVVVHSMSELNPALY